MTEKRPVGRPESDPPQEMMDDIIDWLSEGKTLRSFCRQPGMPAFRTVYNWCDKNEEFIARFVRARDVGHDMIAEETLELADERPESVVDNNGVSKIDSGYVQWQKMRIEQRLKLLAKWNPRKYGDKTIHSGDVDNPIAITEVRRVIVD